MRRPIQRKDLFVDELIIGAGLAGLSYGLTSVEPSYKVAIVESHTKPGGYATNFFRNRRKHIFDCSQHKITGIGENGNLRNAFERMGVWEKLDFKTFNHLATVVVKGKHYLVPSDTTRLEAYLLEQFPHEAKGIRQFIKDILTHGKQNYMFARMLLGEYEVNRDLLPESRQLQRLTTKAYYRTLFGDEDLVELLGAIAIYLGAIANEANALYFLHYLYAAFETNAGFVEGTSQSLSNLLADEFKARGGVLSFKDPAQKIWVEDGKIVGVQTRKHNIRTNKLIATCSPELIVDMLPEETVPDRFRRKLDELQIGWGHMCVYAVTDVDPVDLGFTESEYLIVHEDGDDLTEDQLNSHERYERLTLSVTNYHLLDPVNGPIVQFIVLDHAADWFDLEEDDYKAEKAKVEQLILERAYQYFPELKGHIVYTDCSTPRTNFKYTNSPGGSAFGYKVLPKENMRFLYRPPVEGLKFVGGWSTGPGYETAICLGFSHALLEKRKLTTIS